MAEQVYTNPQTGERIILKGGKWVPAPQLDGVPGDSQQRPASAIISDNTTRTFLNNLMALPSATGDLLSGGAGLVQTVAETPFKDGGFVERLKSNVQGQQQQFPANMLSSIPRPTVADITSGFKAIPSMMPGGETPQDAFNREKAATLQAQSLEAEQRPFATTTGQVFGDIATLATGRQPFAKGLVQNAGKAPTTTNKVTRDALEAIAKEQPELVPQIAEIIGSSRLSSPGAQRLYRRVLESGPVRSLVRGLGKGAEASLEGAVMGAIKGNDPVVNAGLVGGSQLALSLSSTILGVPTSMKELAWKAASWTVLLRLGQEFLPGENNTFTAGDSTFNKIAGAVTIGAASQALGGRFRGSETMGRKFAEDLPRISDAINSIPRGALISFINKVQKEQEEGGDTIMSTLGLLSTNPTAFPESIRNRLRRSLNNSSFPDEVKRLRDNEAFTSILDRAQLPERRN